MNEYLIRYKGVKTYELKVLKRKENNRMVDVQVKKDIDTKENIEIIEGDSAKSAISKFAKDCKQSIKTKYGKRIKGYDFSLELLDIKKL